MPLTDLREVTASSGRWDEWCAAWSGRAAVHEELGSKALAEGYKLSAGEHLTRETFRVRAKCKTQGEALRFGANLSLDGNATGCRQALDAG